MNRQQQQRLIDVVWAGSSLRLSLEAARRELVGIRSQLGDFADTVDIDPIDTPPSPWVAEALAKIDRLQGKIAQAKEQNNHGMMAQYRQSIDRIEISITNQLALIDRAPQHLVDRKLDKLRKREGELIALIEQLQANEAALDQVIERETLVDAEAELRSQFEAQETAQKEQRFKQWKRSRNH